MISFSKVYGTLKVTVLPVFSNFDHGYVWAYKIKIENFGKEKYELIGNYWQVPNEDGEMETIETHELEHAEIAPGSVLEFVGGPPHTEFADLVIGSYSMLDTHGDILDIHVPLFTMDNFSETIH